MGKGMKTYLMIETDSDSAVQLTKLAAEKGMSVSDYANHILMGAIEPVNANAGFVQKDVEMPTFNPVCYELLTSKIETPLSKEQVIGLLQAAFSYMVDYPMEESVGVKYLSEEGIKSILEGFCEYIHCCESWVNATNDESADWLEAPDMALLLNLMRDLTAE